MHQDTHPISRVVSEYLEAIYTLHAEGEPAFAVTLAELFGVSRANASATVQRMVRDGLVYVEGRHLDLTEQGRVGAETGLRRHHLTECFLLSVLGIDWSLVHEEARSFERGLTPLLEEQIDRRLEWPRTCPHGNPVPRADQAAGTYLRERGAVRLSEAALAQPLTILMLSELLERQAASLALCASQGLQPGAPVTAIAQSASARVVELEGAAGRFTVEASLARHIWAVPA